MANVSKEELLLRSAQLREIRSGVWRHYSGKLYLVDGVGRHTENGELLVSYIPLYEHPAGGPVKQFRPLSMWFELVEVSGKSIHRFVYVGNELQPACSCDKNKQSCPRHGIGGEK